MKKTILAGITKDNELYFLEIEPKSEEHNYFSMSGFTVRPTLRSEAVKQAREQLEDGEIWKQAVEAGTTVDGLEDWIEEVLLIDGELAGIDNSLFEEEVEVDREDYIFESGSCGQHEEEDLKHYIIDKKLFTSLMAIWKEYHLKEVAVELPVLPEQDLSAEAIKAIKLINAG